MRKVLLIALVAFLAMPLFAGQGKRDPWGDLLRRYGDTAKVKPGAWAAYHIYTTGEKGEPVTLDWKMACVGTEEVDGQEGIWLEIEMVWPPSDEGEIAHMIMKSLMVGDLDKDHSARKVILQMGDQPPMLVNPPRDVTAGESELPEIDDLGTETVTVPAGEFTCRHLRSTGDEGEVTDIYLSQRVTLLGVVKAEAADGKIELVKYGPSGAVSQIKGEPVEQLDMQKMMQQMMQQNMNDALRESLEKQKEKE